MELASSKDPGLGAISSPDVSFLEQSLVTDQISLLSKEWRWEAWSFSYFLDMSFSSPPSQIFCFLCAYCSYAEQLVLYMKAEEFLSSALHTAKENIKQGQLLPSATVKQGEASELWFRVSTIQFLLIYLRCRLIICSLSPCRRNRGFWVLSSKNWMSLRTVFPLCSDQEAERIVQELCHILPLTQPSAADLLAWQTEAYGSLQWTHSREAHLQPHRAHGELTSQQETFAFAPNQTLSRMHLWLSLNACVLNAFRSSLLLWMRCSTMARHQSSATTKPFCWWRACHESSRSKRTLTA